MSSSPYALRVHRVMDHVRRNLDANLELEALARLAHFSPFHFHRIFKAVAGETLAAFTRRARLERAAYLMKAAPTRELGSIAHEVGFAAQADFSRAFRRLYGLPPSRWDRKTRLHPSTIPAPAPDAAAVAIDPPLRVEVREHPACRLAYVRMRTPFLGEPLRRGYATLTAWLDAEGFDWRRAPLLGLSWDNYETTPIDQVRYDFGFVVPPQIEAEGEVGIHELPAVRAAEVHVEGGLPRIAAAWDHLYDVWFPDSGCEPDDLPAIKRFVQRPDTLGWDTWDLDCSIALRPCTPS